MFLLTYVKDQKICSSLQIEVGFVRNAVDVAQTLKESPGRNTDLSGGKCGELKRIKRGESINTWGQPTFYKRSFFSEFSARFLYIRHIIRNNTLRPKHQAPGLRQIGDPPGH